MAEQDEVPDVFILEPAKTETRRYVASEKLKASEAEVARLREENLKLSSTQHNEHTDLMEARADILLAEADRDRLRGLLEEAIAAFRVVDENYLADMLKDKLEAKP